MNLFHVGELYENRYREEELSLGPTVSSFRIHKAASIVKKRYENAFPASKPINDAPIPQETAFFSEDSSFADYFGIFSSTADPEASSSTHTNAQINPQDEEPSMPLPSPEKTASPTRLPLSALMQYGKPYMTSSSSSHGPFEARNFEPILFRT